MNKKQKKEIGKRLQQVRKMSGESQAVLGAALGCISTTVSKYERGEMELYAGAINLICARYGINHNWLLTGEGGMLADLADNKTDFMAALLNTDDRTMAQLKLLLTKLLARL